MKHVWHCFKSQMQLSFKFAASTCRRIQSFLQFLISTGGLPVLASRMEYSCTGPTEEIHISIDSSSCTFLLIARLDSQVTLRDSQEATDRCASTYAFNLLIRNW